MKTQFLDIGQLKKAGIRLGWNSSKGNQNKWEAGGIWYKEDALGYEALAEILVSRLLEKTNLEPVVHYRPVVLERKGKTFRGCGSEDFMLPEDDKIVSVERLFQAYRGESAAKAVLKFQESRDRIRYIAEEVERLTGLCDFGNYLRKVLTVDALFLNEDRHFHNLAVIRRKDGTYRECPIFDQGASLFSDMQGDYPLEMDLEECFAKIEAKPFSRDFDEQLDACEMLYGGFVFRAHFTMKDVNEILAELEGYYEERILNRVREVIGRQMRKYSYFFE